VIDRPIRSNVVDDGRKRDPGHRATRRTDMERNDPDPLALGGVVCRAGVVRRAFRATIGAAASARNADMGSNRRRRVVDTRLD